jgi:flagellar biosynthesis anti-sigma factor FlgM
MEIRKLFGQQDAVRAANNRDKSNAVEQDDEQNGNQAGAVQGGNGQDVISLSRLSRQLSQISGILDDDEQRRAARVADLKQKVQSGNYSVDSKDVASSLISYAGDVPPLGGA